MARRSPSNADLIREVESLRRRLSRYEALDDRLRGIPPRDRVRQDWFRTLFAQCPLPYQSLDANGCVLDVNSRWLEILGYTREEVVGRWFGDFLPEYERGPFLEGFEKYKAIGELHGARFELICKAGGHITTEFEGRAAYDSQGRFAQTHCVFRDVTEQKRYESRIKEREAALLHAGRLSTLGEMASGIAHELNQPLAAILSYGDASLRLTQARRPDIPRIARNLEEIVLQGERAGVIVRRMRALAKGRQSQLLSADLNDAVRNAVALIRWDLAQHGIELTLDLAESLPPVHADAIQIEQVLLNLIRNAIDAMRRNDEAPRLLTVRTTVPGEAHVQVEVCDSGVGLPPVGAERMFEPFFTTKPDGLGIGLSISHSIVEAHQGTLEARANPDRGATFFFTLPVQRIAGR